MSLFKTKNSTRASLLYYQRKYYYQFMRELGANHILDFHYGEKYLFGRVDTYYTPMIFIEQNSLKPIENSADPSTPVSAINFVTDAFHDMSQEFKIASMEGKIKSNDSFLSNLKAYKAYENVDIHYQNILNDFSNALIKKIKSENKTFLNFNEFADYLVVQMQSTDAIKRYPFTKTAFVKSRLCPMNISGFVIEIANLSFQNDAEKVKKFVRSPNFPYYVQMCNNHGFMIDLNSPWRLIADFNVPEMRLRARRYIGPTYSASQLLQQYFDLAGTRYYENFKNDLLKIYTAVRKQGVVTAKNCDSGLIKDFIIPETYTIAKLNNDYPEEFFLKLYFNIRFEEEETAFSKNQRDNLVRELMSLYYASSLIPTLVVFERFVNKTFDYSGSMTYIINARNGVPETRLGGEY
ncbi:MAG TPA: hypothetical protein DCM40_10180 [Maribacter sp.]|nr:hypothetical protein [Maribacter sp.]